MLEHGGYESSINAVQWMDTCVISETQCISMGCIIKLYLVLMDSVGIDIHESFLHWVGVYSDLKLNCRVSVLWI